MLLVRTLVIILLVTLICNAVVNENSNDAPVVVNIDVKGEITPITVRFVHEGFSYARSIGARLIVLRLDTPGGQVEAVKELMVDIESMEIPVAALVVPIGAVAWSGGAYVLMASHIAAMAPGTTIGSCQPIQVTPWGIRYVNSSKVLNAMSELLANHARLHSRNETVARLFVEENLNIGPSEALRMHVIEFIAEDVRDLLQQLEEWCLVKCEAGTGDFKWRLVKSETLTKDKGLRRICFRGIARARIVKITPGLQQGLLQLISNPLIADLLLLIGLFTLVTGLKTPGVGMELAGTLMILLAIMGFGIIGIEEGGLFLVILGFILAIAELKTHVGILLVLGLICMTLGGLLILPLRSWWIPLTELRRILLTLTIASCSIGVLFGLLVYKATQAQRRQRKTGPEALIGKKGITLCDLKPIGEIRVGGEIWRATAISGTIKKGRHVEVVRRDGLTLIVRECDEGKGLSEEKKP